MSCLLLTEDARDDLVAIWLYIARDNLDAANRFKAEVDSKLRLLLTFPSMGEAVDHLRPETRRFNFGSYQLFYELIPDGIQLLRVYHAARRIEDLFD